MPLKNMPIGAFVYNVELKPGQGGKLGRSAGTHIELIARDQGYADLKMPSSEVRKVLDTCWATLGEVSNDEHHL
jgi:large subunit ribosomal protein L2